MLILKSKKNLRKDLIEFFTNTKNIKDKKVHAFAKKNGINEHVLEDNIYSILVDIFQAGKYHKENKKVNEKELKMGISIEKEHTNCPLLAERIAKDHLMEIPDYYTRLKKMEEEAMQ